MTNLTYCRLEELIFTYNRTTKSAIDQKKSVIDDKLQGARLWLSSTCPVMTTNIQRRLVSDAAQRVT